MELFVLCVGIACIPIAWLIGAGKGHSTLGAMFGLLLGPLGLFLIICWPAAKKACPFCARRVRFDAAKCAYCHETIDAAAMANAKRLVVGLPDAPRFRADRSFALTGSRHPIMDAALLVAFAILCVVGAYCGVTYLGNHGW